MLYSTGRIAALRVLATLCLTIIAAGCDRPMSPMLGEKPRLHPQEVLSARISAPVRDSVMGDLSPIARHVAIALRDPSVRVALSNLMKANPQPRTGLDLQQCDRDKVMSMLIAGGERGGGVVNLCAAIKKLDGLTLYMDPDRLKGWDPRVAPIVTAVAHPDAPRPAFFLGYRASDRTINLPTDGSLGGPILIVIGQAHASQLRARTRVSPTLRTITRADRANGAQ